MSFLNENLTSHKCHINIKNQQKSLKEDRLNEGVENGGMETGTRVGFYCLGAAIGKGNFSVVRLATHLPTGMRVAVKVLHKTKMSLETLEKTYREVQIMKQLHHRNIVQLYQVIESSNWMYIFMEYVSRGELFDYLSKSGRLTEDDARRKFKQILDAVEYCHRMNIVHRDLKAENLLMDENLNIKLVDFGFGSFYNASYLLSTWCGSPPYAAPELFRGEPYIGPKADIWSLGVVLYVMVCGALPFNEPCSIVKLREQVLKSLVRFPYFLSYECEQLIRIILNRDPSKRPSIPYIKDHKWMKTILDEPSVHNCSQYDQSAERITSPCRSSRRCNTVGDDSGFEEPVDFTKHNLDKFRLSISHDFMDRNINEDVLQIMERCGFSRTSIIKEMSLNIYGSLTATYLLLCEKLRLSRQIHNSSNTNSLHIKYGFIPQTVIPNREYKISTPPSHVCEIDSSLRSMQLDGSKDDSIPERSSPYDNIKTFENKNQININQNNIDKNSRPLSHLSEKPHGDVCMKYTNNQNVTSVVIDLVIPHNDGMDRYSQSHTNYQRNINSPPEMTLYYNRPTFEKESVSTPISSNTYSIEMENAKPSIKSVSPACFFLSPNALIHESPMKYIPPQNNRFFRGHLVSVDRHSVYHPHSADRFQVPSLYNKSNTLYSPHEPYGHSSPLNSTLNYDPISISNAQSNQLFEVAATHSLYQHNNLNREVIIPQYFNRDQSYDLIFDCESQDSSSRPSQKDLLDIFQVTTHHQCNTAVNDVCHNQNVPSIPISSHTQITMKPSLSAIRKSFSSYPETCLDIIHPCSLSRVSHLSPPNIIRLS